MDFDRRITIELDEINTSNPRKFWETLKRLGPKRKNDVPKVVRLDNGHMTTDECTIKDKWFNDYSKLYNHVDNDVDFDNEFLKDIKNYSNLLENTLDYEIDECLNN